MPMAEQFGSPESPELATWDVSVQGDGLRRYPDTRDRQFQDPDQHGFLGYCLFCGMNVELVC